MALEHCKDELPESSNAVEQLRLCAELDSYVIHYETLCIAICYPSNCCLEDDCFMSESLVLF